MQNKLELLNPLISEVAEILNEEKSINKRKRDSMYVLMGVISKIDDITFVDAMGMLDVISKLIFAKQGIANPINSVGEVDTDLINHTLGFVS